MTLPIFLLHGIVVISIFGSFIKTLVEIVGVGNFIPVLRDVLIFGLSIYGLLNLKKSTATRVSSGMLAALVFVILYLAVAVVTNEIIAGIYYLRIYLIPFLFYVGALGIFDSRKNTNKYRVYLKFIINFNFLLFFASLAIYIFLELNPQFRIVFFGTDFLPSAWFISGGTWMRMGLPATGPNTLGIIFSFNAFLFITTHLTKQKFSKNLSISNKLLLFSIFTSLLGLMLTFSRSSMLLLLVSVPILITSRGVMTSKLFKKYSFISFCMAILLLSIIFFVDEWSDGYLSVWFTLNTKFSDPSIVGHFSSIDSAVNNLNEYLLWGYPKGTVGPKAEIFHGVLHNVENTFLSVLYDMGIFAGLLYFATVILFYASGFKNKFQLFLVVGFLPPLFLLPYVFEIDVLIYFSYIYIYLGLIGGRRNHHKEIGPPIGINMSRC
ncbi:O-antigen ligase family protein [Acidovorax sp.]|uniref:O-antigen ligase family protein n=1 Tax=Acidovorax sp. TaxID=1872122 RepID=UPI003BAED551